MRAKIIVLLSSGGAKFAPLLFGLFLMQWFGGGVYTSYVVLLNYAAALTALSCMGSTPQILRAGVTGNANMTVVRAALAAVIGMAILMLLSSAYWFAVAGTSFFTLLESGMWWDLRVVSFYCLGLLFVSLSHSILSQGERWLGLSVSYVTVYWLPLASGVMSGYYFNSGAVAIEMYCIIFFAVSLLSFYRYLKDVSFFSAVSDLLLGVKVSLFAVFLLIGFYVASYYVSLEFGELEGAVYSLSFQLFSISIFIPSVLGSIVIPMLSNKTKSDSAVDGSKVLFVYVGFSSFMAFTVSGSLDCLL